MKVLLGGLALALLLLAGARPADDTPAPVAVAAPAAPSSIGELTPAVPLEVPLSVSETTPPPGWTPPESLQPEQEIGQWLGEAWDAAKWQALGGLIFLAIVAALIVASEKSRYQ